MNKKTELINNIKKTKNLNKLLRLSKLLISNKESDSFILLKDKISSYKKNKNFHEKYLKPILIYSCKEADLKSVKFFFENFNFKFDFDFIFSLLFHSVKNFSIFKFIYNYLNLSNNGQYLIVLLIFINHTNKKLAKNILNHMNFNFSNHIEEILSFLLTVNEFECFKKYTKNEYAFSDFILDYDYENKAIKKYPVYKERINNLDKPVYEKRYKDYLIEKVNEF